MNINTDIKSLTNDFRDVPKNDANIVDLIIKSQVNTKDIIDKTPAIMSIKEGIRVIDIMTEGNISAIKGVGKARKSFAVDMFIAAYLRNTPLYNKFKGHTKKRCILFDTEQSKHYVQNSMFRIYDMSDDQEFKTRFFCFGLRPYEPAMRLKIIEYLIYNLKGLGFLVIDGIRDLIVDINSPEEATMITSKLLKWTDDTQCHILTIIHENNQDGRARGHIGTELTNKAETVIKIEKLKDDPKQSKISSDMVRGLDFEDIYFTIEDNIPIIMNYNETKTFNDF
jgi:hypothetical protein